MENECLTSLTMRGKQPKSEWMTQYSFTHTRITLQKDKTWDVEKRKSRKRPAEMHSLCRKQYKNSQKGTQITHGAVIPRQRVCVQGKQNLRVEEIATRPCWLHLQVCCSAVHSIQDAECKQPAHKWIKKRWHRHCRHRHWKLWRKYNLWTDRWTGRVRCLVK